MRDAMAARHGVAIGDAVLEAVFRDGDTLDGTTNMENDLVPLRRSQACAGSSRCPPRGLAGAAVCATYMPHAHAGPRTKAKAGWARCGSAITDNRPSE